MTKEYKNSIEEVRAIKESMAKKAGYDVWKLLGYKKAPNPIAFIKPSRKSKLVKTSVQR